MKSEALMAHKWRGKVPFSKETGQQLHWANPDTAFYEPQDCRWVVWRDWFTFDATLELDSVRSGNSAKYLVVVDRATDKRYVLFVADLVAAARTTTITNGRITGRWGFCKRGQNYGVYWMEDA